MECEGAMEVGPCSSEPASCSSLRLVLSLTLPTHFPGEELTVHDADNT